MLRGDPQQDSPDLQVSNTWYQARLNLLKEISDEVERIETGAENPNKALDFRRADGTVPLREIKRK